MSGRIIRQQSGMANFAPLRDHRIVHITNCGKRNTSFDSAKHDSSRSVLSFKTMKLPVVLLQAIPTPLPSIPFLPSPFLSPLRSAVHRSPLLSSGSPLLLWPSLSSLIPYHLLASRPSLVPSSRTRSTIKQLFTQIGEESGERRHADGPPERESLSRIIWGFRFRITFHL